MGSYLGSRLGVLVLCILYDVCLFRMRCVFFLEKKINFHGVTLEFSCPARMQTEDAREPNECTIHICVSMQFGIGAIAYDDCYHHLY